MASDVETRSRWFSALAALASLEERYAARRPPRIARHSRRVARAPLLRDPGRRRMAVVLLAVGGLPPAGSARCWWITVAILTRALSGRVAERTRRTGLRAGAAAARVAARSMLCGSRKRAELPDDVDCKVHTWDRAMDPSTRVAARRVPQAGQSDVRSEAECAHRWQVRLHWSPERPSTSPGERPGPSDRR